jgi:multidrug efflux pump subunit AcrA (membrane-fusion protein)
MDRRIEHRTWTRARVAGLFLLVALAAGIAALLAYLSTPRQRVEADKLTVDTVRRGAFQEYLLPLAEVRAEATGPEVRAAVDRYAAQRLTVGHKGKAEIGGQVRELEVLRLGPAGAHDVEVVFRFVGTPPPEAVPGQKFQLRLPLGETTDAVLLARGAFFQATGGHWVWVVDRASDTAVQREIRLGRQNPEAHEVLSGLAPGERVITSTYDHLEGAEELVLTE